MASPVCPGDPGYEALLAAYRQAGGGPVSDGKNSYTAITDVDKKGNTFTKFVVNGQVGTFDRLYGSRINQPQDKVVPMQEDKGQLETTPTKGRKTRSQPQK